MTKVLKLPAYRRLLVAYTINELAWSLGPLALAVLVYHRTGSAVGAMAFFLCSQFVPALFSPMLVARLDQRSPGRVLSALYGLESVAFLILALLTVKFELAAVLALTVVDGVLALTARSIARATTVAVTAPAGLLREGNALLNASFSACYMVGPAIGGVVVLTGGTEAALLANAGLFVVMVITLATARGLPGAVVEREPVAGRLRAARSYASDVPGIRTLLSLQAVGLVFFTISIPVEVVFAQHSLHAGGGGGDGALLSSWGAGAIIGSAVYAHWRGLGIEGADRAQRGCARRRICRDGGCADARGRDPWRGLRWNRQRNRGRGRPDCAAGAGGGTLDGAGDGTERVTLPGRAGIGNRDRRRDRRAGGPEDRAGGRGRRRAGGRRRCVDRVGNRNGVARSAQSAHRRAQSAC